MRGLLTAPQSVRTDTEHPVPVALDDRLVVHPDVSFRPERFGALAYHFGNRRLSFIKHVDLLAVVEALDGELTVREALDGVGVDPSRYGSFLAALTTLSDSEVLRAA